MDNNNQTYKTYLKSFEELREKVDQLDLKSTVIVETVNVPIPVSTDPGTADTQYAIDLSGLSFTLYKHVEYVFRLQNSAQNEGVDIKVSDNNTGTSSFTYNNTTVELSGDGNIDASANPWYTKLDIDNQILFIRSPNINQTYLESGNIYEIIVPGLDIALATGLIEGIQNNAGNTKVEFTLDAEDITGTSFDDKAPNAFLRKGQIETLIDNSNINLADINKILNDDGNDILDLTFNSTVDGTTKNKASVEKVALDLENLDAKVGNLGNLGTTDKASTVNAINEVLNELGDVDSFERPIVGTAVGAINENYKDIGVMTNLSPTATSLVESNNQLDTRISTNKKNIGDLVYLETDVKVDLVSAINEVNTSTKDNALNGIDNNVDDDLETNVRLLDTTGNSYENKLDNEFLTKENVGPIKPVIFVANHTGGNSNLEIWYYAFETIEGASEDAIRIEPLQDGVILRFGDELIGRTAQVVFSGAVQFGGSGGEIEFRHSRTIPEGDILINTARHWDPAAAGNTGGMITFNANFLIVDEIPTGINAKLYAKTNTDGIYVTNTTTRTTAYGILTVFVI